MRRGLISWSKDEVPEAALEARVAGLQQAMRARALDAVLAYTSTVQPAAVTWLTQFVPYSNDGVLIVLPQGLPAFFTSFSKRVEGWIREVSRVGELRLGAQLGQNALAFLQDTWGADLRARRIGVIEKAFFPASVLETLASAFDEEPRDASDLFASVRQPADEAELALSKQAADMARKALARARPDHRSTSEVLAVIEHSARSDGAEEIFIRIAPDLGTSTALLRMEGDTKLGERYAVQVSLAYKGVWTRAARCVARAGEPLGWAAAERWFADALGRLGPEQPSLSVRDAPGRLVQWTLEACIGCQPFTVVGGGPLQGEPSRTHPLPAGALAFASVTLDVAGVPWRGCQPLVLGTSSARSAVLL